MLLGAMLLALALIVLAIGTSANKADAATNIVTKTFSKSAQITIPEGGAACGPTIFGKASPYPSERGVSAFPAGSHIRDVNVRLRNYSHTWPDDVDVLLAHAGTNRTIMSDVGGAYNVNTINITLDDEAANGLLSDEIHLVGGRFRPTNFEEDDSFPAPAPTQDNLLALSGFDTLNPNNTWRLFVQDDSTGDCGTLGGWSITIKAAVPA